VTIGYVAIVYALIWQLHYRPAALIAAIALPTAAFIVITAKTTRGGWRWRWGEKD
jgi:hypothetical protein